MTKKEFLNILYGQLTDQISSDKASAHTQYYQKYIEDEIKKGYNEEDILRSLGDPRLIAKTLIDTGADPSGYSKNEQNVYNSNQNDCNSNSYTSDNQSNQKHHHYHLNLSTWYGKLIVILAAAAILALLFVALSFLLPVILTVSAVLLFISWFRKQH